VSNWTPENNAELDALWSTGLSSIKIGRLMGRSKNSIIGHAHRRGLDARQSPIPGRHPPKAAPAGKTTLPALSGEAASRIGVNRSTTDEDETRIRTMRGNGMGYKSIAARAGVSTDVVRRVVGARGAGVAMPAPSKPLPVALVPFPRVPDAPRPVSSGSCAWPLWGDKERPKFGPDGLPLLCGGARSHGSYCRAHGRIAYVRKAEAA
jgi:hypothetical protein